MLDLKIRLQQCLSQARHNLGVPKSYYDQDRDIDALLNAIENETDPIQIAATTIDMIVVGRMNTANESVVLGVIRFLDEVLGSPREDRDKAMRTKALFDAIPTSRGEYIRWATSWYC
jgi:hypothetical protein